MCLNMFILIIEANEIEKVFQTLVVLFSNEIYKSLGIAHSSPIFIGNIIKNTVR